MDAESEKPDTRFRFSGTSRLISWAESRSATGRPVFFFQETPSSVLDCQEFHQQLYERNISRSKFQAWQSIGNHASDKVALAKPLELQEYVVMGGRGGGPYTLACGGYINPNAGMDWNSKLSLNMAQWAPGMLRWLSNYSPPLPKSPSTKPLNGPSIDSGVKAELEKNVRILISPLKLCHWEIKSKSEIRKAFGATLIEPCI